MKLGILSAGLIAAGLLLPFETADAAIFQGTITSIWTSGGGNYAFRVTLATGAQGCNANFFYLNTSDDNYQARVSMLMTAYSLSKAVFLQTTTDQNGFCRIVESAIVNQ